MVEDLQNVPDVDEITVYTEFCEIIESEDASANINEYRELDSEEINDAVANVYYDIDKPVKKKETGIADKTLEAIGLKPVNVYAASNYKDEKSAFMKKSILVCPIKYNNKQFYHIYYLCHWLQKPENRLIDTAILKWDSNAAYFEYNDVKNNNFMRNHTSAKITYIYADEEWDVRKGTVVSCISRNETIDFTTAETYYCLDGESILMPMNTYAISPGGMAVSFNLKEDVKIANTDTTTTYRCIDQMLISMDVYIKKSNEDKSGLIVQGNYSHQQTKIKTSIKYVKISFESGVEFAISCLRFVSANLNSISCSNYSKLIGGQTVKLVYQFK